MHIYSGVYVMWVSACVVLVCFKERQIFINFSVSD